MKYIMESPCEGERLIAQHTANASDVRARLQAAGLGLGMRAVDVGCGAGAVLPEMLALVGPDGSVVGVDPSRSRLEEAEQRTGGDPRVALHLGALPGTDLPAGSFDFVWSQFVLQYFGDPMPALDELVRLAAPGGRVAVAEVDRAGRDFWPVPSVVAEGIERFVAALSTTGFDLEIGRKMFHRFRARGLADVTVHASMLNLVAGTADKSLLSDWRVRFETLTPLIAPAFGSTAAWLGFCSAYLDMLADPDTLKFGLVLTTSGIRP